MSNKKKSPAGRRVAKGTVAGVIAAGTIFGPAALGGFVANAAPTNPTPGLGATNPTPGETGAPTNPTPAPKEYWIEPAPEFKDVPTRPAPSYQQQYYSEPETSYSEPETSYSEPETSYYYEEPQYNNYNTYYDGGEQSTYTEPEASESVTEGEKTEGPVRLHLPEEVDPVAPIEAPEGRLRMGDYIMDKPDWMSEQDLDKTNNTSAAFEAQAATFWKSVGFDVQRSDRTAAATIAGAASGAVIGATALGVPAAVVGGVGGAAIGATGWAPIMGVIVPGIGTVPGAIFGGVGGAAIGAAALGVPAVVVGGTVGGIIGAAAGAAYGAGDTLDEPIELHFNKDKATETEGTEGVEGAPLADDTVLAEAEPAPEAEVAPVVEPEIVAPEVVETTYTQISDTISVVRDDIATQDGGKETLAQVDAVVESVTEAAAPVISQAVDFIQAAQIDLANVHI